MTVTWWQRAFQIGFSRLSDRHEFWLSYDYQSDSLLDRDHLLPTDTVLETVEEYASGSGERIDVQDFVLLPGTDWGPDLRECIGVTPICLK